MGYRPGRTTYLLDFSDVPELAPADGEDPLEVRARSAPLGTFLDMTALASIGSNPTPADIAKVGDLLLGFATVLKEWNVEDDDGQPVPPTEQGLRSLEFPFVFRIIAAWIKATAGVAAPLGPASSGGEPSEVPLPPMAPLSTSPAS